MFVGYGRVSTDDQDLALQRDALTTVGCERIFSDTMSGSKAERPGTPSSSGGSTDWGAHSPISSS
jgi:DNA invertase Pin-like site-specific DNA recombinase